MLILIIIIIFSHTHNRMIYIRTNVRLSNRKKVHICYKNLVNLFKMSLFNTVYTYNCGINAWFNSYSPTWITFFTFYSVTFFKSPLRCEGKVTNSSKQWWKDPAIITNLQSKSIHIWKASFYSQEEMLQARK